MPKARQTTPERRKKRFREKYQHRTVPLRFKVYLPRMNTLLTAELINLDELERQIYDKLDSEGVSSDLYPYYMAFSKRVFKVYLDFLEPTANTEATSLKQEFIWRGLDTNVLAQLISICKEKAYIIRGIVLPPEIPSGVIVLWSGLVSNIPSGWALCDGNNGTPDLRDRFILGAAADGDVGETGGASSLSHSGTAVADHPAQSHEIQFFPQNISFFPTDGSYQDHPALSHTVTQPSNHADSRPPYYKLAYIMKL